MKLTERLARATAAAMLALVATLAQAGGSIATFSVTSTDDTQTPGTLRQAILDANASSATDARIEIDLSDGSVILLGSDLPTLSHPAVQIRNLQPANAIAVDGDDSYRLFVHLGTSPSITISDLEMRNGSMTSGFAVDGGACLYTQGRALLYRVRFSGCTTINGNGGAVHAKNNLLAEDSQFSDNTIFHDGTSGYRGGAIYCDGVFCDITGSSFTGNRVLTQLSGQTERGGGAVFSRASEFRVENSDFIDNVGLGRGGAIHLWLPDTASSGQIRNTLFRANSGGQGGAVWAEGLSDDTVLTVDRSIFDRNVSSLRAPALKLQLISQVDLAGNLFNRQASTNTLTQGTVFVFSNNSRQSLVTLDFNTFVGEDENSYLFQVDEVDPTDVVVTRMHANIFDQRVATRPACIEEGAPMNAQEGLFNVVTDDSCTGSIEAGSLINVDPRLTTAVLPSRTIVYPDPDSPAIDLVDTESLVVCSSQTDLDGTTRPLDGDDDGVPVCDAGAVERNVDVFSDRFES